MNIFIGSIIKIVKCSFEMRQSDGSKVKHIQCTTINYIVQLKKKKRKKNRKSIRNKHEWQSLAKSINHILMSQQKRYIDIRWAWPHSKIETNNHTNNKIITFQIHSYMPFLLTIPPLYFQSSLHFSHKFINFLYITK